MWGCQSKEQKKNQRRKQNILQSIVWSISSVHDVVVVAKLHIYHQALPRKEKKKEARRRLDTLVTYDQIIVSL